MGQHFSLVLHGKDGSTWPIEGPDSGPGKSDVFLLPGPRQFYHSPAITYWINSGGAGQKYQGFSYGPRKPLFALCTYSKNPLVWRALWSDLSLAFGDPDDTFKLEAITEGGPRFLDMRLRQHLESFEAITDLAGTDPHLYGCGAIGVDAQCEQPHWYRPPVVGDGIASYTLPSGTSGSTATFPHPGNPGPVVIWPRWSLTAPATWTLPDWSYGQEDDFGQFGQDHSARTHTVTPLVAGEDVLIDTNQDEEYMVTVAGGLGPLMRSMGNFLIYPVAPFTPPHNVPVSVTGATAGATATIECDRWFDTPFGRSL